MTAYDPDWKEKQEALAEEKRLREEKKKKEMELAEERLAIQGETPPGEFQVAKEIPEVAKKYLARLKGEMNNV